MKVRGVPQMLRAERRQRKPSELFVSEATNKLEHWVRVQRIEVFSNSRNTQQQIFGSPNKKAKKFDNPTERVTIRAKT